MGLDITLYEIIPRKIEHTNIFHVVNGEKIELSIDDIVSRFNDLDIVSEDEKRISRLDIHISHDYRDMAKAAGVYEALWRPYLLHPDFKYTTKPAERDFECSHIIPPSDLIPYLEKGLNKLKSSKETFVKYQNEFSTVTYLIHVVENVLEACKNHPNGYIRQDR